MDITQTIVQEIVAQCGRRGFVVSGSLAHFHLVAQTLKDPKDGGTGVELTADRIEELVDRSVSHLTKSDCPSLETFKLQASVTTLKQEQLNKRRTSDVQHRAKAQQLVQDVCSKSDPTQVCAEMTLYILHETHLFSSTNDLVQKETMTALESVIPRGSVAPFIAQKTEEKSKQLEELWRIVWGIRLFNKKCQKGGAGIPNLPEELVAAMESGIKTSRQHLAQADHVTMHYQVVLTTPSIQLSPEGRQRLIDEYVNRKQFALYLRNIQRLLEERLKRFHALKPTWDDLVEDVKGMVSQSISIPKSSIYPRFIDLSDKWDAFRDIHQEVLDCKKILDVVTAYQSPFQPTLNATDVEAAMATRAEEPTPNKVVIQSEVQNPAVNYLPEMEAGRLLEFNGFCIPSLLDRGMLLDGKKGAKSPGYLHLIANDTYYAFTSERLLKTFARDPFKYLSQQLLDVCAAQPDIIYLLGLQSELPKEIYLFGTRVAQTKREVVKADAGAQTGQIEAYKDYHYEWNEWELRRLALKVANLRSKQTHAAQTMLSHHRRDNEVQTYLPKAQETQTMLSKAIQPSKKVQYIKGLRGANAGRSEVVRLQFDQ